MANSKSIEFINNNRTSIEKTKKTRNKSLPTLNTRSSNKITPIEISHEDVGIDGLEGFLCFKGQLLHLFCFA